MTLPAAQQRVLDRMEDTLQASEPELASMFSIFHRLNEDDLVGVQIHAIGSVRFLPPLYEDIGCLLGVGVRARLDIENIP